METKAWAVDRSFMFPNWFGLRTGVSMSWNQSKKKDSKTSLMFKQNKIELSHLALC